MEFKKVKLNKAGKLSVVYNKEDRDDSCTVTEEHRAEAHQDFLDRLADLRVHFGILTGYIKAGEVKKIDSYKSELLDSFYVSGYSVGGADEDQGIVLTGHRILPSKKAITLNSPFTRFNEEDDSETKYKFMDELIDAIADVQKEAVQYLGGKFKANPQQELSFKGQTAPEHEATR